MSFTQEVKRELCQNKKSWLRHKYEVADGLFSFGEEFSSQSVRLKTTDTEVVEAAQWLCKSILGKDTQTLIEIQKQGGFQYYIFSLSISDSQKLCQEIALHFDPSEPEKDSSFWFIGVFLSCGRVTDPNKSYRLELFVGSDERLKRFQQMIEPLFIGFRTLRRKEQWVVYTKECQQMEDFLTLIGATHASLSIVEIEMIKAVRNTVNRQTNCETANIGKQVDAAVQQLEDIQLILQERGTAFLSASQKEAADLRLEYPQSSLRELVEKTGGKLSRSGLHHRFSAIHQLAEDIRQQKEG